MQFVPDTGVISFARGIPSPDMFPIEQLTESSRRAIERHGRVALNYGPAAGFRPLREWLADRHGVAPERIVVTPGSLVAMNFLVRHLLPTPRRTLVEAPTYDRALHLLRVMTSAPAGGTGCCGSTASPSRTCTRSSVIETPTSSPS